MYSLFYKIIEMSPFHEGIWHGIIRYDGHVFQQIIFFNIGDEFWFQRFFLQLYKHAVHEPFFQTFQ